MTLSIHDFSAGFSGSVRPKLPSGSEALSSPYSSSMLCLLQLPPEQCVAARGSLLTGLYCFPGEMNSSRI